MASDPVQAPCEAAQCLQCMQLAWVFIVASLAGQSLGLQLKSDSLTLRYATQVRHSLARQTPHPKLF